MEGIRDNNDYTPEQLVQITADNREKDRLYQYHYQKALRANPTPEFRARNNQNNAMQEEPTRARQRQPGFVLFCADCRCFKSEPFLRLYKDF
jgi:hypothetical protein